MSKEEEKDNQATITAAEGRSIESLRLVKKMITSPNNEHTFPLDNGEECFIFSSEPKFAEGFDGPMFRFRVMDSLGHWSSDFLVYQTKWTARWVRKANTHETN